MGSELIHKHNRGNKACKESIHIVSQGFQGIKFAIRFLSWTDYIQNDLSMPFLIEKEMYIITEPHLSKIKNVGYYEQNLIRLQ